MPLEMPVQGDGMLSFLHNVCKLSLEEFWALELCRGDQFSTGFPALKQTAVLRRAFRSLQEKHRVFYSESTGRWLLTDLGWCTLQIVDTYHWLTEPADPNHRAELIEFPSLDTEERKRETVNT